jgi:hypothetical protein
MTVSTSTHVMVLKAPELNKCPLKISLVGIPQETPSEVKKDIVVKVLVTDYVGQDCEFIVKVVFSSQDSRLAHLKNTIRPQESLVFVVGQMEIINNEFYIYTRDINFINTHLIKKKGFENSSPQNPSVSHNSARSKLMITHQNITENSKEKLGHDTLLSIGSSNPSEHMQDSDFDKSVEKLVKTEYVDCESQNNELIDLDHEDETVKSVKRRKVLNKKGKECAVRSLHDLRSHNAKTEEM